MRTRRTWPRLQARHRGVLEQATRFGDGPQVMGEEAQVELAEGAALRTRLQIVRQRAQIVVPVGFVLGVELHHPGVVVQLVEGVLQGVLQRIARLPQPGHLAALGADRRQLEEGRHRPAIFQQHALAAGQVLDPGQQVRERRRDAIERIVVGLGGRPAPAPPSALPARRHPVPPAPLRAVPRHHRPHLRRQQAMRRALRDHGSDQAISSPPRARPASRTARAGRAGNTVL